MTKREQIEAALVSGPLTGGEIRARLPEPIGSIALHRYLWNMRERGYLSARRTVGVWSYALADHQWPVRASVWDWRAAA